MKGALFTCECDGSTNRNTLCDGVGVGRAISGSQNLNIRGGISRQSTKYCGVGFVYICHYALHKLNI